MGNLYIVLGNGFSIDLINKLGKSDEVNLKNLFVKGADVNYPKSNQKGFLSKKYCPSLWTLGARTTMCNEESTNLINDIITCANIYNVASQKEHKISENTSMYVKAYLELSSYLRYLFIYYNNLVSDDELKKILDCIDLITYLRNNADKYDNIFIVTYNYDIWLERILKLSNIDFSLNEFEERKKIQIFKPHGSISFSYKTKYLKTRPYTIKEILDDISQDVDEFEIVNTFENDYPIVNAIIPPAGDANSYNLGWIETIRQGILEVLKSSSDNDELILFGLSYWHVDRHEINQILINLNSNIDVKFVNPVPPTSFDAVLSSLFKNYIHYNNGKLLKEA